jgi:hypothetical protein
VQRRNFRTGVQASPSLLPESPPAQASLKSRTRTIRPASIIGSSVRRFIGFLLLTFLILTTAQLPAQEAPESTSARQLMFVPPPVEGVISLGVYDGRGKLIRVLNRATDLDDFKAGLNGLLVQWDGNDSSGRAAPNGHYSVRGVLVGDIQIDGVAFHLNNWQDLPTSARPRKLLSATLVAPAKVAVLAETDSRELIFLSSQSAAPSIFPDSSAGDRIKGAGTGVLILAPESLACFSPDKPGLLWQETLSGLQDADQFNGRVLVAQAGALSVKETNAPPSSGWQKITVPSSASLHCAVLSNSIVVATDAGELWKLQDNNLVPIDLGGPKTLLDLTAGRGDTIWLLIKSPEGTALQQVDLTGHQIRELPLPADLQNTREIAGSREEDALLLTLDLGSGKRLVGLKFQAANSRSSVWEKWLDRSLTAFTYFDLRDGMVTPADNPAESPPVFVKPANNPMENTRQAPFQVSARSDSSGVWLCNSDGLPLIQVCETKNVKQLRWALRGAGELRVYVSDGSVVEEYKVSGLEKLYRFDAGSFD